MVRTKIKEQPLETIRLQIIRKQPQNQQNGNRNPNGGRQNRKSLLPGTVSRHTAYPTRSKARARARVGTARPTEAATCQGKSCWKYVSASVYQFVLRMSD